MQAALDRPVIIWKTFAWAFAAAAVFALTCRYPGYVHHDTAEIAMWSRLGWPLGLPKHPPLLPWLFRIYSYALPLNWVTLSLLTAANIVLGAWAVWRIALLSVGAKRAAVALMLYGLAPAGTFFALKLNHNAILVSLWPLTILAFLQCLRAQTVGRSAAMGVVFGALAAAAMLAKYYSGVLLACCFVASLVSADRNRFYKLPGAYLAVATFLLLVAPHVWWMWENRGATLDYALHESEREAHPLLHFLTVTPMYLVPMVAAFIAMKRWLWKSSDDAAKAATVRQYPELCVLAVGPFVLTAAFILAFKLRGATSWSLPDFCVVPVLLAAILPQFGEDTMLRLKRAAAMALTIVAAAGPVVGFTAFALGDNNATEPRVEFAQAAGRIFAAGTRHEPNIVAGDPQSTNAAALDIGSKPAAFTNFNSAFAPWVTPQKLDSEGLLVICRPSYGGCREQTAAFVAQHARASGFVCSLSMQRWWLWKAGRLNSAEVTVLMPKGTNVDESNAKIACATGGPSASFVRLF